MSKSPQNAGASLVESLIVVFVIMIIVVISLESVNRLNDFWKTSDTDIDLHLSGKTAIGIMEEDLKRATRTAGANPPDARISPTRDQISYYLPADIDGNGLIVDANGNTEWNMTREIQLRYDAASRQLLHEEYSIDPGTGNLTLVRQRVIISNVYKVDDDGNEEQAVTFDDFSTDPSLFQDEVRISLNLQKTSDSNRVINTAFVFIIKLRN